MTAQELYKGAWLSAVSRKPSTHISTDKWLKSRQGKEVGNEPI